MSRPPKVVCRGAPRDLGLDQGMAAREFVRTGAARLAGPRGRLGRLLGSGPLGRRVERDTARFFPHLAERAAGLARGADVSTRTLAALLARELQLAVGERRARRAGETEGGTSGPGRAEPGEEGELGCFGRAAILTASPERTGSGPLMAGALGGAGAAAGAWLVRRSEPQNGYASVEVGSAWLVTALTGVNERGLAVAASATQAGSASVAACAAPASLLVQECLQRFDQVEKAIEWCARRPAGGRASILLADARGCVAGVLVNGSDRRIQRALDGVLLGLAQDADRASLQRAGSARRRLDAGALRSLLDGVGGGGGVRVLLDPLERRMGLLGSPGVRPEWISAAG